MPPEGTVPKRAELAGVDLRGADLHGADLEGAYLRGADLASARGIVVFGPVGEHGRIIYGVAHPVATMVHAGCWWGTIDDTRARVAEHYADGSGREQYRAAYLLALDAIAAALGGVL